jgi:hypothetical protein
MRPFFPPEAGVFRFILRLQPDSRQVNPEFYLFKIKLVPRFPKGEGDPSPDNRLAHVLEGFAHQCEVRSIALREVTKDQEVQFRGETVESGVGRARGTGRSGSCRRRGASLLTLVLARGHGLSTKMIEKEMKTERRADEKRNQRWS